MYVRGTRDLIFLLIILKLYVLKNIAKKNDVRVFVVQLGFTRLDIDVHFFCVTLVTIEAGIACWIPVNVPGTHRHVLANWGHHHQMYDNKGET